MSRDPAWLEEIRLQAREATARKVASRVARVAVLHQRGMSTREISAELDVCMRTITRDLVRVRQAVEDERVMDAEFRELCQVAGRRLRSGSSGNTGNGVPVR